jgi:hypothetical protein
MRRATVGSIGGRYIADPNRRSTFARRSAPESTGA